MDQECDSPAPDRIGKRDGGMANGVEDIRANAKNDIVKQEESHGSILSPLFSGSKPKKRLTSKVWEDFIPTFVDGKLAQAECMHCHRVFSCSGTSGTTGLRNHQAKCSSGTRKRLRQQEHMSLAYTQKSMAPVCSDPKQKKLPFLLSSQKECTGTTDAMTTQKELQLPKSPSYTNRTNQEVHQNVSHGRLAAREGKNLALPGMSAEKNTENQSRGENALHEQDIPTDPSRRNLEVDQNCFPEEVFRILAMQGHHPMMMEQDGFKKLVSWLNPMVKMPSHSDVIQKFLNLYKQEKSKLKEKLTALCSRVCLSVFMWHYDPQLAFICLSAHYIDDEWVKQQKIIRFCCVDPSRSIDKLTRELNAIISETIKEWGLHGKVFSIILDDAFSDDLVVSNVEVNLQEYNKEAANRSFFVVRYATHLLDGVIQVLVGELDRIMEISSKHSDYKMGPITSAVHYPNCRYRPSMGAWRKAQKVCEILEDFHKCMDFVHSSPSSADVFDTLWDVKDEVHVEADMYSQPHCLYREEEAFSNVRWEMQNKFNERWKVCFFHLCMPMVMDPKYRLKRIKSRIQHFNMKTYDNLDTDIDDYIHYVHDTLLSLFNEYSSQVGDPNCTVGTTITKESFVNGDELVEYYLHTESRCPYGQRPLSELDQYLQEPHLTTGESSVLQWWKEHSLTYPTIARMARDILALPSSTDCKVATKIARIVMSESGRLHYWVQEVVCTQDWLKLAGTTTVESTDDF